MIESKSTASVARSVFITSWFRNFLCSLMLSMVEDFLVRGVTP